MSYNSIIQKIERELSIHETDAQYESRLSNIERYINSKIGSNISISKGQIKSRIDRANLIVEDSLSSHIYSGDLVEFKNLIKQPLTKAEITYSPVQSFNGYDKPWKGGSGSNKLPCPSSGSETKNSVTIACDGNGKYSFSGTSSAASTFTYAVTSTQLPSTVYLHIMNNVGVATAGDVSIYFYNGTTKIDNVNITTTVGRIYNASSNMGGKTFNKIEIKVGSGKNVNGLIITPMFLETGDATEFTPYANVCPITGRSTANIWIDATHDTSKDATKTASLGSTLYGGKFDFISGKITKEYENIASYNGESITKPWLSSYDEYSENGTPTTGAQVVYKKATATTSTITGHSIEALVGQNYVWSNGDSVIIEYGN